MHPQSIFSIRHWDLPEILFVAAGCFAMGAVGFFVAVFLQLNWGAARTSTVLSPIEDKEKVMQEVAANSPQPAIPEDQRNQSDPTDTNADAKLKLLKSLGEK